jgi:hypothetical protein
MSVSGLRAVKFQFPWWVRKGSILGQKDCCADRGTAGLAGARAHHSRQTPPEPPQFRPPLHDYSPSASSCNTSIASRALSPAFVYSSICRSPVELPNAAQDRRPIMR